ncbi:unnamed protein product [Arabidopsis halleri]
MSIGCLSCLKAICSRKNQIKKEGKPLKAERLPEPVGVISTNENIHKFNFGQQCGRVGSNDDVGSGKVFGRKDYLGVFSSPMNNDFNKVKTFDLREVSKAAAK